MPLITVKVERNGSGERLDAYIGHNTDISRSFAANLAQEGRITVNGVTADKKHKLKPDDCIVIDKPEPVATLPVAQDIAVDILYQDKDIAVINKPRGMVVHPSAGHWDGTLVNALLYAVEDLSGINGELRPGIVHRLDKNTSGILVIAKNDIAHRKLAVQFKDRTCEKYYLALVCGNIAQDSGIIEAPIGRSHKDRKRMAVVEGGRDARTGFEVLERFGKATLVRCRLYTGRTHQIRVHMAHIGHPCIGDDVYGAKNDRQGICGQLLHSAELYIDHPITGERLHFTAQPPQAFTDVLNKLRLPK